MAQTMCCALLITMLIAGCATSGPHPTAGEGQLKAAEPWKARPFPIGERMVYRARVAGVDGARATLSVGQPRKLNDRDVLPLRVTVEGYEWLTRFYPLKIKLISLIDLNTLLPVRCDREGTNGSYWRRIGLQFQGQGRVGVDWQQADKPNRRYVRLTKRDSFDMVSGLYEIRAWLMTGATEREMHVFDGAWTRRIRVTKGGIEEVWTPSGSYQARRFEVVAERIKIHGDRGQPRWEARTEKFSAWVTEDDQLIPVRLLGETPAGPAEVLLENRTVRPPEQEEEQLSRHDDAAR